MNSVTLDGVDSLVAAWPLAIVAIVMVWLVSTAFARAGQRAGAQSGTGYGESGPARVCRAQGHHYLKGAGGWRCSHCGEEIRHAAQAPQRTRQVAGV